MLKYLFAVTLVISLHASAQLKREVSPYKGYPWDIAFLTLLEPLELRRNFSKLLLVSHRNEVILNFINMHKYFPLYPKKNTP